MPDLNYVNLTKSESKGLESFERRKDVVIFETDKSGRMAVDSKEGYVRATEPHVINDPIIEEDTHIGCQKEVNAHSTMWVRFLGAGKYTRASAMKGMDRLRNNMKVQNQG